MRVFITGATGFIGTAVVQELLNAGHRVLGMTRSESGARALASAGAEAHYATLEDLDAIRAGAAGCDAVIHLAFNHDFSKFAANCETDRLAVEALGAALAGSGRPLLITSGIAMANTAPGQPATEESHVMSSAAIPRAASEEAAASAAARGVNVSVVRLPQVHNPLRQGLVSYAIQLAKTKGVSAYVGDGLNRWPAAHLLDTARLYRLALEKGAAWAVYHAVAEEGVAVREIAETVGRGLNVPAVSLSPEEAQAHFGWLGMFAGRDLPASSALTRERLGWHPTGPGLIADLEQMDYSVIPSGN